MGNPFVWLELRTPNPATARAFYESLFDWQVSELPWAAGTYTLFGVGEGTGGGVLETQQDASAWLAFVQVDDLATATKRARKLGAVVVEEWSEGPAGVRSVITDPTGALLALWQPK